MELERRSDATNAEAAFLSESDCSRRAFLKVSAAGGALLLSFLLPAGIRETQSAGKAAYVFAPNAFIRIGRDGRVALIMPYVEMGQGIYTATAMLIAEELEVDLGQVTLEAAPSDERQYANPLLKLQATGDSSSTRAAWEPFRRAGATARVMLLAAAAQTWKVDSASCRAEKGHVIHPKSGRRLPYGALVAKAATLPIPDQVPLKDPKEFSLIGTPAKRLDTPDKVNGKAAFSIDTRLPGMKIATVAACPVFGGKLVDVDDSKAKRIKGVHKIVRLENAVAVVADHMWAAKRGLGALDIQWDEGPHATLSSADIVRLFAEASARQKGGIARKEGDVEKALANAAQRIEATYQLPFLAHATMEPMNCTVHVRKDSCEVWVSTQVMSRAQAAAAQVTGLPLDRITVHNHVLGGGFGRRLEVDFVTQAVQIAKHVDGPVKMVWTREEDIQHDIYRPAYYDTLTAGLDAQGMPVAWRHRVTGPSVYARWLPEAFKKGVDLDILEAAGAPAPYPIANLFVDYVHQEAPGIVIGWWRGVASTHNIFVVESFMDELAVAAKMDPLEYRRSQLSTAPRVQAVLDLATEKAGWGQPLPPRHGRGVSVQFTYGSCLAQVAEVEVATNGQVRVHRVVCAVDCGIVVNPDTVKAQMEGGIMFGLSAALFNEITIRNGRVEQSNFHDYRMLRIDEAPIIDVYLVKSAEPPGGLGEAATVGAAPALTNAIFAATGIRIRTLPVSGVDLRTT
jgi:isoquinoline 1-oxidoreductase beta subunit